MAAPDPGFSQSLERGLAILGAFTPDRPVLGISELARMFELTRSTTHRYVATLATLGYLQQDEPTRKYRLGPRVLDLGFSVLGRGSCATSRRRTSSGSPTSPGTHPTWPSAVVPT